MSKGIKIILIIILIIAAVSALAIFLMRKQAPPTANPSNSSSFQNALPASQPAPDNQKNQANTNSSAPTATNTLPTNPTTPTLPAGKETSSSEILNRYGKFAFNTFQKYPSLVDQLKGLDPNFNPSQMDPSYPSRTYRLSDGNDYLALGGCTAHNCAGTKVIVLYNVTDNKVYLGRENSAETQLQFFGDPSDEEKNTMTNFYLQK